MAMLAETKRRLKLIPKALSDMRTVALYLFLIVVLAIAWSSVKTIQKNYELQKEISLMQQQNSIIALANQNIALQNKYLQTDQYLELAARQSLGLAAPGEKVLTVPKNVAMKYVDPSLSTQDQTVSAATPASRSKYIRHLEAWRDFLLGRKIVGE